MIITIVNTKPTLTHNNFRLGSFENEAAANSAAVAIKPLLNNPSVAIVPLLIDVIRRNGGS